MIHLDTSFVIDLLRERRRRTPGPASELLTGFEAYPLGVSVFVACELEAGVRRSSRPDHEQSAVRSVLDALTVVYPDARFGDWYGEVLQSITTRGRTMATMDLLIGVAALVDGAPLVTRNRKHFEAIPDLELIGYRAG